MEGEAEDIQMLAEGGKEGNPELQLDYHGFPLLKCVLLSQLVWKKRGVDEGLAVEKGTWEVGGTAAHPLPRYPPASTSSHPLPQRTLGKTDSCAEQRDEGGWLEGRSLAGNRTSQPCVHPTMVCAPSRHMQLEESHGSRSLKSQKAA